MEQQHFVVAATDMMKHGAAVTGGAQVTTATEIAQWCGAHVADGMCDVFAAAV